MSCRTGAQCAQVLSVLRCCSVWPTEALKGSRSDLGEEVSSSEQSIDGKLRFTFIFKQIPVSSFLYVFALKKSHSFQITLTLTFSICKCDFVEFGGQLHSHKGQTRSKGHHTCCLLSWDVLPPSSLHHRPFSLCWPFSLGPFESYVGVTSSAQVAVTPTSCHCSPRREGLGESGPTEAKSAGGFQKRVPQWN